MAKFLIYNKSHWMELPSKSEPTKTGYKRHEDLIQNKIMSPISKISELAQLDNKYNSVEKVGDIVDVFTDNYKMTGKTSGSFCVIGVDDLSMEDAKQYQGPLNLGDFENGFYTKKICKCNIDITGLIFNQDKEAIIKLKTFQERLTIKS